MCRSKGYGFIEFPEHFHALACLRQLNNNPKYSAKFAAGGAAAKSKPVDERPRLIVEFTVEDWREVKKQEHKKAERKRVLQANIEGGMDIGPKNPTKKSAAGSVVSGKPSATMSEAASVKSAGHKKAGKPAAAVRFADPPAAVATMSGVKRRRPVAVDAEIDAALSADSLTGTGRPAKSRRSSKRSEQAEAAAHDAMVAAYKQRLFGSGAASEDLKKWM